MGLLERGGVMKTRKLFMVMAVLFIAALFVSFAPQNVYGATDTVYYIPVEGEVGPPMVSFISREIENARQQDVSAVVLEISTFGGRVDSALEISDVILNAGVPTVAYIKKRALSAGVIITISAEKVAMAPGTTIGSAETIPYTEKNVSAWAGELRTVAEQRGRDGEVVASMADRDIEIPGVTEKGKLLNLTASRAVELGVADKIVKSREELHEWLGLSNTRVVEAKKDFQLRLAGFVASYMASALLLTLGFVGLIAEVFIPGFGIAGTLGLLSFGLFFAGNMLAGHAGWAAIILFVVGIILLLVEVFIPGFGVPGVGGIIAIFTSIVMASRSLEQAVASLAISLIISIVIIFVLLKFAPRNKFFDRLILSTRQKKEEGYVNVADDTKLIGREGVTLTPLRPAGSAVVDGSRVDVITQGEFVNKGDRIKVLRVEGNRIMVEKIN